MAAPTGNATLTPVNVLEVRDERYGPKGAMSERSPAVTFDELLAYCLAKPGAWQDEPWEGDIVAKVGPKIFAFIGSGTSVGLKCGPSREVADEWLHRYPEDVSVMAYIGRSGWNSLAVGGGIPDDELLEAIDASYEAIVSKLPKKDRPA
jgi:predicted DNA-binding protein (MmcQ/YjbR family)